MIRSIHRLSNLPLRNAFCVSDVTGAEGNAVGEVNKDDTEPAADGLRAGRLVRRVGLLVDDEPSDLYRPCRRRWAATVGDDDDNVMDGDANGEDSRGLFA